MSDLLKIRIGGSAYLCKWDDKGFVLDIPNFDLTTLKQKDIQFYGFGITKSADGQKLLLSTGSAFTMPLQNYNSYDFEMHFNVIQWSDFLYPCARMFLQGSSSYNGWGITYTSPGNVIYMIPGYSYRYDWSSWGYINYCYSVPIEDINHIKYKEVCRGTNYKVYVNDVLILEYESQLDYNSLSGDANYNTSTANGLNKCGFIMDSGQAEITYFRIKKIS